MENNVEKKKTHQEDELKHLGFVRSVAINTILSLLNLYDYAKHNSGPLRSAVGTVEGAVTTVVTPVFEKFKGVPDHLLAFLDHKVDVVCTKFDEHAPSSAKQVASQIHRMTESFYQIAKELVHQTQVGGPYGAASYATKESKHLMVDQTVKVWSKLDQLPPFHKVADITVPMAAHLSDKYNGLITDMRGKGYAIFSYVPLVPLDEIANAFEASKGSNRPRDITNPPEGEVVSN